MPLVLTHQIRRQRLNQPRTAACGEPRGVRGKQIAGLEDAGDPPRLGALHNRQSANALGEQEVGGVGCWDEPRRGVSMRYGGAGGQRGAIVG